MPYRPLEDVMTLRHIAAAAGVFAGSAADADPTLVRVKLFGGLSNLPIFAGQAKGIFAKHGLRVEVAQTPDSDVLRQGLAAGAFEIAAAGVDNALAMVDTAGADAIIVMGGDSAMNSLLVQPEITSIAALSGKQVIVDAPNTAYALVAKKILALSGLQAGRDYTVVPTGGTIRRFQLMRENKDYAASMLNPPSSISAEKLGFRNLGSAVALIGPYQGTGAFVMRRWAQANAETLERYLRGYLEALRWALEPANKSEVVTFIAERYTLPADLAAKTHAAATDHADGLTPDARLDIEGLRNVLALRAEIERAGARPEPAEKYYDLTYYQRALAALGRQQSR
jgi:ABC-type nitrate/sulfonate/bicarbonate transport system substrate-binding protein